MGFSVIFFPFSNCKLLKGATPNSNPPPPLSLSGTPLAVSLLCDSRLPSPLSTRASVTKGVALWAHTAHFGVVSLVLFSNFTNYEKEAVYIKPKQFVMYFSKFNNWPIYHMTQLKSYDLTWFKQQNVQPKWRPAQKDSFILSNLL